MINRYTLHLLYGVPHMIRRIEREGELIAVFKFSLISSQLKKVLFLSFRPKGEIYSDFKISHTRYARFEMTRLPSPFTLTSPL